MDKYGIVDGWPGVYWLELAAPDTMPKFKDPPPLYYCNFTNGQMTNTHAIVRALNWWNSMAYDLSKSTEYINQKKNECKPLEEPK